MCTVTYIPMENTGFMLTHNRDESVKRRIATPPVVREINGIDHVFPVDPVGKGTWIGASATGRVASLLNGGRKPHRHEPPYRHSRGLVIPAYFSYPSFIEFFNDYDFEGLEPFTLLVFEQGNVFETVMDEDRVEFRKLNSFKPVIYTSTTLYTPQSRARKEELFFDWYSTNRDFMKETTLDFHRKNVYENEPDELKLVGDHILKTVSISSIVCNSRELKFEYFDLVNDIRFWHMLDVERKVIHNV